MLISDQVLHVLRWRGFVEREMLLPATVERLDVISGIGNCLCTHAVMGVMHPLILFVIEVLAVVTKCSPLSPCPRSFFLARHATATPNPFP